MIKDGETIEFACPFCSAKTVAGSLPDPEFGGFCLGVMHTLPLCARFEALEPDDFMAAVNDATLDPGALEKFRREWSRRT